MSKKRSGRAVASFSEKGVMALARRFSKAVGGSAPKYIGEYRWSDANKSATVVTYSPEESVKVVCVVSAFADGSTSLAFFSDEYLSETNRFENITHFTYRGANVREMVKDLKWVWKTVDGYRRSWSDDE